MLVVVVVVGPVYDVDVVEVEVVDVDVEVVDVVEIVVLLWPNWSRSSTPMTECVVVEVVPVVVVSFEVVVVDVDVTVVVVRVVVSLVAAGLSDVECRVPATGFSLLIQRTCWKTSTHPKTSAESTMIQPKVPRIMPKR